MNWWKRFRHIWTNGKVNCLKTWSESRRFATKHYALRICSFKFTMKPLMSWTISVAKAWNPTPRTVKWFNWHISLLKPSNWRRMSLKPTNSQWFTINKKSSPTKTWSRKLKERSSKLIDCLIKFQFPILTDEILKIYSCYFHYYYLLLILLAF